MGIAWFLPVCAVVAVLAACGGTEAAVPTPAPAIPATETAPAAPASPASEPAPPVVTDPAPSAERCRAGEERTLAGGSATFVAIAKRPLGARSRLGGPVLHRFGLQNVNRFPTLFAVLAERVDTACKPAWYRVQLPVRPNGAIGYVRASAVWLERLTTRIEIDLSERRIELLDRGRRVLRLTAAVGAPATPTPTGRYYVNQRLRSADPSGPYGPGGIGISAFSPVLTGWAQGGPIAIHGTNAPSSIGLATSNGCLRVPNAAVERLFDLVPAGTPVTIRA